jgi:hypothetical protein
LCGDELTGTGAGRELELLEAVRGKLPPEVFTTPYSIATAQWRFASPGPPRSARSATIGKTPWSAAGGMIVEAAGVYVPPDLGPREDSWKCRRFHAWSWREHSPSQSDDVAWIGLAPR